MSDLVNEYSYFRADGVTADAIGVVLRARVEAENIRLGLCMYFGAYNMAYGLFNGKAHIQSFSFHHFGDVPDEWETLSKGVAGFRALPKDGSADHFTMLSHQGKLTNALRRCDLGFFFDIPPLPVKQLPPGSYSQRFVRKETYVSEFRPYLGMRPEPQDHGNYKEHGNPLSGETKSTAYQQVVTFRDYNGAHYVRVPNDAQGKPLWVPPDSHAVSYDDMLALDFAAYRKAFGADAQRPRYGV